MMESITGLSAFDLVITRSPRNRPKRAWAVFREPSVFRTVPCFFAFRVEEVLDAGKARIHEFADLGIMRRKLQRRIHQKASAGLRAVVRGAGGTLKRGEDRGPGPALSSDLIEKVRSVVLAALLHNFSAPDAVFDVLGDIATANNRGHELYGQVSPCPLTMEFTLQSAYPFEGMDAWKPALGLVGEDLVALLEDPSFRSSVRRELANPAAIRLFNGEWQKLEIVEVSDGRNRHLEGRNIAELAEESSKDPLDCMLDLACAENWATSRAITAETRR